MRVLVMTALLALAFCFEAEAQNNYMMAGWGPQSCGEWTKVQARRAQIEADEAVVMPGDARDVNGQMQWVLGFISAFNAY